MTHPDRKRVFLGFEVSAPWPNKFPGGRLLDEAHRHLTLAFLGAISFSQLQQALKTFPLPPFLIAPAGKFDTCLLLPPRRPHAVAWGVNWLDESLDQYMRHFQKQILEWLKDSVFFPDEKHEWLPHVTLARSPFDETKWKTSFEELPFIVTGIHLYESMGNLRYIPCWSYPLRLPLEEFEHTADMAFKVVAENYPQLYKHAFLALTFRFPKLLAYYSNVHKPADLDHVIFLLTQMITKANTELGCPFKAVSCRGGFAEEPSALSWVMGVDV